MILFEPGPPTPPLHRRHPAVKDLDRLIRDAEWWWYEAKKVSAYERIDLLQDLRRRLVGKRLRPNSRTGARSRQKRLELTEP